MQSKTPLLLFFLMLAVAGCSDRDKASETEMKDHVLRQQVDLMNDAKAVTGTLNRQTEARNAQSEQLTGH